MRAMLASRRRGRPGGPACPARPWSGRSGLPASLMDALLADRVAARGPVGVLDQAQRLEVVGGVGLERRAARERVDEVADRRVEALLVAPVRLEALLARGRSEQAQRLAASAALALLPTISSRSGVRAGWPGAAIVPPTTTGAPGAVSRKTVASVSPATSGSVRAARAATTRSGPHRKRAMSRWWISTSASMSRGSWVMKGCRTSAGRRPVASGSRPEDTVASSKTAARPAHPRRSSARSRRYQGRKRQFSCTMRRQRPATRRTSASASASVGVSGFWHSTSMPRAAAASTQAACVSRGEATSSASGRASSSIAAGSAKTRGDAELLRARPGPPEVGVAHAHELHPPAQRPPGEQVVAADHPGPGEGHPERPGALRHHDASPKRNSRTGLSHRTRARSPSSGSQRRRTSTAAP